MTAMSKEEQAAMPVEFKLNGRDVVAHSGETIIQTAKRHGVEIPHLCYMEGMRPDGNCRACVVEVKGERVLAASCCRKPATGMEVLTDNARAVASQKMVLELLLSDMPKERHTLDSRRGTSPRPTCRTTALRSISTRVSSARGVSAPAARSK